MASAQWVKPQLVARVRHLAGSKNLRHGTVRVAVADYPGTFLWGLLVRPSELAIRLFAALRGRSVSQAVGNEGFLFVSPQAGPYPFGLGFAGPSGFF